MSFNIIELFPSSVDMSRFKKGNFKPGLIDFRAIDPSRDIEDQNHQKIEIKYDSYNDTELFTLSNMLENIITRKKQENSSLTLYDHHGCLYNLYLKEKSLNI